MDDHVVTFASPPVVEVVAGVSFVSRSAEVGPLLSAFWKERLRDTFPHVQQQPPYSPRLEVEQAQLGMLDGDFGATFPWARLWATSHNDDEVLQLQPGWFACNWRKVKPEHEYDRWLQRRASFAKWYEQLAEYLEGEGVSALSVNQCEVTYVNHIYHHDVAKTHAKFDEIFKPVLAPLTGLPVGQVALQMQQPLDEGGSKLLHTKISPAIGRDGRPLYVLDLTVRGVPDGAGLPSILEFLDSGRTAIDKAFVAITSEMMHREWGIQDGC
ncbi:TIGR04255 family protein [Lentzea sp. BCCO 10_0856]|uniref:TIGR04255 family protein n=1 Tax=Lentzea miocenica TaxID=3095431 RepID=A0ABU4TEF2_9PSEU|nr:TIGR04255 family protein [Lentzea sp. BCCO 10_0856]MDX8036572.1 TIGR04255 family protein [Lentzea sp. BCCO 10_0856]